MPINLVTDELTRFNLPLTSSFFEAQSDFGHVRDNTRTGDALRALPPFFRHWSAAEQEARAARQG